MLNMIDAFSKANEYCEVGLSVKASCLVLRLARSKTDKEC